jgi:hypothetical protein
LATNKLEKRTGYKMGFQGNNPYTISRYGILPTCIDDGVHDLSVCLVKFSFVQNKVIIACKHVKKQKADADGKIDSMP